jgi:hypothetical protein
MFTFTNNKYIDVFIIGICYVFIIIIIFMISDGEVIFSARVLLRLLEEAQGVPVIFAVVTSTGHVMLQVIYNFTGLIWI